MKLIELFEKKTKAVSQLEKNLEDPLGYNAIDNMMKSIANKNKITPHELHNEFKKVHNNQTPDDWIKKQNVVEDYDTEKQILTRIRQIKYDRKLSGTESNAAELHKLQQKLKDIRNKKIVTKENFADKKVKGRSRPGRVKRAGASCKGSVTDLRAKAEKYSGERGRMYHWCANMKAGHKK